MNDLSNTIDFDFDPKKNSQQANAVYDSAGPKIVGSVSKQEEGKKYFFRLFPFNSEATQRLGMNRPEMHVKKYMFKSPIADEDGNQKYIVTTSEKSLDPNAEDTFKEHVLARLKEMTEEGDDKGINLHNKLFSGPYSRKDVSVSKPLEPNEFGIIEVWVGVVPIQEELQKDGKTYKSVPAGDPMVYNIKTSGRNQLFGRGGKRPIVGVVDELEEASMLMRPVDGVDFYVIKSQSSYTIKARRETTTLAVSDDFYLDENRPNPFYMVEDGIRSEEACALYDVAIGKLSVKEYEARKQQVDKVEEDAELAEGLA